MWTVECVCLFTLMTSVVGIERLFGTISHCQCMKETLEIGAPRAGVSGMRPEGPRWSSAHLKAAVWEKVYCQNRWATTFTVLTTSSVYNPHGLHDLQCSVLAMTRGLLLERCADDGLLS
ncbi:hypothetical protein FA13DRAFT_1325217 [Coprinellus micaceus]|uniref:Secreted protein n=1 Tax=Coprinellus micaceus TaxID=71717 RepID=A0A4Y7SR25_COPMI|nr:hypothetical protein FA13DRAFT_1325217 [Coprinellus micaceus]